MASQADVRRIALALPGAHERADRFAFYVEVKDKPKDFAWVWQERVDPKKARVPNPRVLAVRVANLDEKDALIAGDPDACFTEPHYHGFPAVLVRLAAVTVPRLRALLAEAWRCQAPPALRDAALLNAPARSARAPSTTRPRAASPPTRRSARSTGTRRR